MRSVKFNYCMNTIMTLLNILFPILVFPYLSRVLLPEGMGRISFAMSIISYLTMIAQIGIPVYGIRACARVRDDKYLLSQTVQELLLISLGMTMTAYLFLGVLFLFSNRMVAEKDLLLIMSLNIALGTIGMQWLFSALEQYTYITLSSCLFKIISMIMVFLFVHDMEDYLIFAIIYVLASGGSNLCNLLYARRFISFHFLGEYRFKHHMQAAFTFFATKIATSIYNYLDIIMLGLMTGSFAVGLYDVGVKISSVLIAIVCSLSTVLLPRMSYYIRENNWQGFRRIIAKSVRFNILIALPLMLYFIFFAQEIIQLFAGSHYQGAVLPLQLLLPTVFLSAIWSITGSQMLVPLGKEKQMLWAAIAGAIVDFTLNLFMIPAYGGAGAAISTSITHITVSAIYIVFLRSYWKELTSYIKSKSCMGITSGLMLILWLLKQCILNSLFWKILLTFSGYVISYAFILLYLKEPLFYELLIIIKNKWICQK